ncbi:MAG: hypothetical protein ACPGJW_09050 [Paracoccaceae bacterium]
MIKECDDFEIVFGKDKPKWGRTAAEQVGDDAWQDKFSPEDIITLSVSETISMFQLYFRGHPIKHDAPDDGRILKQFRCKKGWLVITDHFASESWQSYWLYGVPHWMPLRRDLARVFPQKNFPIGRACFTVLYFDEQLELKQQAQVSVFWKPESDPPLDGFPRSIDPKIDLTIEDEETFHLDVMDSERLTFHLHEEHPKGFDFYYSRNVDYYPGERFAFAARFTVRASKLP